MAKRSRWLRRAKWAMGFGLLALAACLVTGWMLVHHVPAWYRPVEIAPEDVQAVRNDLARAQNDLGERITLSNTPFEYKISQSRLNAWLSAREDIWPLSREWLPPGVSQPFVNIEPGGVRVGATVAVGGVQSVVSGLLEIRADQSQIRARLAELHGGSLPVPEDWLREQLSRVRLGSHIPISASVAGDLQSAAATAARSGATLADVFTGISIPNEGVWWEPKRPYKVTDFRVEGDSIVVTIDPQPYRRGVR